MNISHDIEAFTDEISAQSLFSIFDVKLLFEPLSILLKEGFALESNTGELLLGNLQKKGNVSSYKIVIDFEPIAFLLTPDTTSVDLAESVCGLINRIVFAYAQYHMASNLHLEVVNLDFNEMLEKNEQLAISEQRYKELAEQLEQKVSEQVDVIHKQQIRLYQHDRLASIGHLAAGIAHEVNNPISFVNSNINAIQGYCESFEEFSASIKQKCSKQTLDLWQTIDGDELLEDLRDIVEDSLEGCSRIKKIVADLKDFSCLERMEHEKASLVEIIQSAIAVCEKKTVADIIFTFDKQDIPEIACQSGHISQAIYNVLENAIDATANCSSPIIKVNLYREESQLHISIDDNGTGIDPTNLKQVFTPFYTTKDVGSGTGLGLSVTREIIQSHNGNIDILPHFDHAGTQVFISLPIEVNA